MCEVLINHMYSGGYLKKGNIGYEIINLFKCDNGEHYIYTMSAGDYAPKHRYIVKYILLVRNIDAHTIEVLAKAEVSEDIFADMSDDKYICLPSVKDLPKIMSVNTPRSDNYRKIHNKQIDYINKNEVKYGGVFVNDIFIGNITYGLGHELYLTYKVENFRKTKSKVYLMDDGGTKDDDAVCIVLSSGRKRMAGAAVATYEQYEREIKELIDTQKYWEDTDTSEFANPHISNSTPFILDVIKKRFDEITYSNWIAYYLKHDKDLLNGFVNDVLRVSAKMSNAQVIRESMDNIDIWIEDDNNIFVIENKIKSSINGTAKTGIDVTNEENDFSQLTKYYDYTEQKRNGKKAYYYLLLPDYAYKNGTQALKSLINKYDSQNHYIIIRYSDLKSFFEKSTFDVPFYDQFILALNAQSQERADDLYAEMLERFSSAIILAK